MSKKKIKIISVILSLTIIVSLITFKNIRVNADVSDMPTFDVKIDSADPNPALVGEDITVSGTITPQPFETTVPAKEIVLVLDVSGSMAGSKIKKLKEATNNFIDKMSTVQNLKIGIVAYSDSGYIKKVNDTALINSDDIESLHDIVKGLNANGGTNTGDGLRSAAYLLNNSTNANKTIVLMSDGEPTFRVSNIEWKWKSFLGIPYKYKVESNAYTDITKEGYGSAERYGTGNSDEKFINTNYAVEIGKVINSKNYNTFSIGYGMDDEGSNKLRMLQGAMSGFDMYDKSITDEEKGFYETSEGAIDSVFNKIANKIIENYPINNVALNMTFNDNFSLNIGGNTVNIENINYKKESQISESGKFIYKASPIKFSFKIKGNKSGIYPIRNKSEGGFLSIFKDLKLVYNWQNQPETEDLESDINVTINSNELPIIQANLLGDKVININENQELTLKYDIDPKSFSFNDETNSNKSDVVFVIDVSKDMANYMNPLINDLWNDILNNDRLKIAKTEYDIIIFSNKLEVIDLSSANYSNYEQYITDLNNNYIKNKLKSDNDNSKNINNTYNDIINLLDKGRVGARKNVVFISETSNINYGTEKDYGALKLKGYNIITVEIENLNNSNNKNDLKDLHKLLGGVSENYFYSIDQNNLQNNILSKVADRIASNSSYNDYKFTPKLQIDLGENFDLVSGGEILENNIMNIKVPEIVYKYSKTDNIYNAEKTTVKFTVKPKNGKIGRLRFGSKNELIYKKLIKNEDNYSLVETPIVVVTSQIKNITHGLYNGIISNGATDKKEVSIHENNNGTSFEMAQGSTVTFGSKFTIGGNSVDFALNIDNKFKPVSTTDIKIYKVSKDSSGNSILTEITNGNRTIENQGDNKFKVSINNIKESNQTSDSEILVIYQARVKDGFSEAQPLTNEIKFSNLSKDVNITTPKVSDKSPSLPDLF